MKRFCALLFCAVSAFASTHIHSTLLLNDGVTPMTGSIQVIGPTGSTTNPSTTQKVTIGAAGVVDFYVVGCQACSYRATYSLTNASGVQTMTFAETWIVPDVVAVLTIPQLWGGSSAPYYLISQQQISGTGLAAGQVWQWNGTAWVAATPLTGIVPVSNGGTGTGSTLSGIVRGSASAMTAAELSGDATTSGSNAVTVTKINGVSLAGLATGIVKNTTTTGAPSIAVAGDFPTLNQNTSGTAAGLSGTPALPNGTTATTQTPADGTTKVATDAYVDALGATKAGLGANTFTGNQTIGATVLRPTAGSTDESTAINAQIAALSVAGGGSLTLTGGTYNLARHISCASGVSIVGQGAPILRMNNQTLSNLSADAASGQKVVSVTSVAGFLAGMHVMIQDVSNWEDNTIATVGANSLTMTTNLIHSYVAASSGQVFSNPPAIWCEGVSNVMISGLKINGNKANNSQPAGHDSSAGEAGVYVHLSSNVSLLNSYIHDTGNHNVLYEDSTDSLVAGNTSDNAARHGFDFYTSTPASTKMRITVSDNSATGAASNGFQCHQCTDVTFIANRAQGNTARGMQCASGSDVTYTGNIVTGNGNDGIQLDTCSQISVGGNTLVGNVTYGLRLYTTTNSTVSGNNTFKGNYTSGSHTAELHVEGTSTNNTISGNTFTYVAGGATTALAEADSSDYTTLGINPIVGAFTTTVSLVGVHSAVVAPMATPTGFGLFNLSNTFFPAQGTEALTDSANRVYVWPWYIPTPLTIGHANFKLQTNAAASTSDVCIYSAAGSLLLGTGGTDTSVSANVLSKAATTPQTLQPGWYLFAQVSSSTTVAFLGWGNYAGGYPGIMGAISNTAGYAANAATAGVCPTSLGAITQAANVNPVSVWFTP